MFEAITGSLINSALPLIQDALTTVLATLLALVFWAVRRYLGAQAQSVLERSLDAAIDRAIAKNGSAPGAVEANLKYILDTKFGTVQQLQADEAALRRRIEVQQAQHQIFHGGGTAP